MRTALLKYLRISVLHAERTWFPDVAEDNVQASDGFKYTFHRPSGEAISQAGFTLIELALVLVVLALLASLAVPVVTGSIQRAKESSLREDVYQMRKAIDDYYADNGAYPQELDELAAKRYLRRIPVDPITERRDTWVLVHAEDGDSDGIVDVFSGSEEKASDGTYFKEW